jgi:hypothetical protein
MQITLLTTSMIFRGALIKAPDSPPCDCEVSPYTQARGRNAKHGRSCGCKASFVINGKNMCTRHAQKEALNEALILCGFGELLGLE